MASKDLIYHNQALLQATERDYVKKIRTDQNTEKWAKRASIPFSFSHVTIFTFVTLVAFFLLFPTTPLPYLLTLFAAGFIIDGIMYAGDVRKAFAMFFGKGLLKAFLLKGLFADLEKFILKRELSKAAEKNLSLKHFFKFVDQKATDEIMNKYPELDAKKQQEKIKTRKKELREKYLDIYIAKWHVYKKKLAQHQQKSSKRNRIYSNMQSQTYINNTRKFIGPIGRENKNPLFMFGSKIEKIKEKCKKELITKKILIAIGAFSAVVNGIGFGCVTFTHILPLLTIIIPTAMVPLPLIGIATLGAFVYGMLMYATISNAIKKNIFKKLIQRFGLNRDESTPKWKHYSTLLAKIAIVGVVGTVASISMTLMAGAWLDSAMAVVGFFLPKAGLIVSVLVQAIMYGVIMPVNIIFSISHASGTINKSARLINYLKKLTKQGFTQWGNISASENNSFKQSMKEKPILTLMRLTYRPFTETGNFIIKNPKKTFKFFAYALGAIIAVGSLAIHLIVEASMTAGEGANSGTNLPGKIFQKITALLRLESVKTALIGSCFQEGLEHLDFIFKYFKPFSRPFYAWPKRMIKFLRDPKADITSIGENRQKAKQAKEDGKKALKTYVNDYKQSKDDVPTKPIYNPTFSYYHSQRSRQNPRFAPRDHGLATPFELPTLVAACA